MGVDLAAAACACVGAAYEALENRPRSVAWLVRALRLDAGCAEALDFVVDRRLLSADEAAWLRTEYTLSNLRAQLRKVRANQKIDVHLSSLGQQLLKRAPLDGDAQRPRRDTKVAARGDGVEEGARLVLADGDEAHRLPPSSCNAFQKPSHAA